MTATKVTASVALLFLWSLVGWIVAQRRRIYREMVRDDAVPRPVPGANFLLLLSVIITGLSGVLLYFIFG